MKLDIGCGDRGKRAEGCVGIDNNRYADPDILCDASKSLPFKNDIFSEIVASHVIEHVDDLVSTLKEMYRVSKDGCIWKIGVPHFSRGYSHPFHTRGFGIDFWNSVTTGHERYAEL